MKYKILFFAFLFFTLASVFAQNSVQQNNEGYFSNPIKTNYGIVVSNEYESSIYLINGSSIEELVSAPGCGRFLSVNKQGNLIGFKFINTDNSLQCPAILDLSNGKIIKLTDEVENAGQVTFADDGSIVYSIGNKLFVKKGSEVSSYDLGLFSNRVPVSPDGKQVIFKDDDDQLWIFDLQSKNKFKFTDSKIGYGNACWSPDGNSILYTSVGTDIYSFNLNENTTVSIGEGENPSWSPDSKYIIYNKKDIDFNKVKLVNSDIYLASADGSVKRNLTNTSDEIELDAKFSDDGKIIYHNYLQREILQKEVSETNLSKASASSIVFKLSSPLNLKFFNTATNKEKMTTANSSIEWVHIHQVYDTRNSGSWYQEGEGYVCCGATSAMEVLASYGILQPWPFTTYSHTSNYGLYISDPYTFNGYTYSGYDGWPSGAHGYLWNGSGSPYSNTVNLLKRHGITNTKRDETVTWSNVTAEINAGYPYIVCSTGLTSGHIVVIIGLYGSTHTVICNDPYGDKNVGSYGGIRNGKNAIYDWSDANTGRVKVTPVVWAVTARFQPNSVPEVVSYSPASVEDSISNGSTVSVSFTTQMDSASTINAFHIEPAVDGNFTWSDYHQTLSFQPATMFAKSTRYNVTIDTTAKSVWSTNLSNELKFEFTVKSREYLKITSYYPEKNENEISTTVQFTVMFDSQVDNNSFTGNVLLYNSANQRITLSNVKVKTIDDKTYLTFEPKNALEANSNYTLLYCNKIYDLESYHLKDTLTISFTTDENISASGNIIDNFDANQGWQSPSFSSSTVGVDTTLSTFAVNSSRKHNSTYTGKLSYSFLNNEGGLCRVYNSAKPDLSSQLNSKLGIYIFGDNSNNLLELWFDENGTDKNITLDTLNWTGWKFKSIDLSSFSSGSQVNFNGIAVRQEANAGLTGEVYFDDLMTYTTTDISEEISSSLPAEFNLSQNYPNPFNPTTNISYSLPENCNVQIKVYNSVGEMVKELISGTMQKGLHQVTFNGSDLSSGVYFYTINAVSTSGNKLYSSSRKLILLK